MYKCNLIWLMFDSDIATAWFIEYMSLSAIHSTRPTWWQASWLYQIHRQVLKYLLYYVRKWIVDICNAMSHQKSDFDEWWRKWSCECEANWFVLKQSKKNSCEIQNLMIPNFNHRLNACCWRTCSKSVCVNLIQRELTFWLNNILFFSVRSCTRWYNNCCAK